MKNKVNKRKVINDPVYGFITIPYKIIFNLIEHSSFQRLRRITQLGLSHLVYPGALHNRYHHALGACHLMHGALSNLRAKGVEISEQEMKASLIAILLHDVGHGPYSHALEHSLIKGCDHEDLSLMIMKRLNREFDGKLSLAIDIFTGRYEKEFLHQLVSSQLDVDRLDYLKRDSFYSGVSEGIIGNERILKMLDVRDNQLVVEEKGIYSIEKFLVSRRLMYWQVYLHKTVLVAETLLSKVLARAKDITAQGESLFGSPALLFFLKNDFSHSNFENDEVLQQYLSLDDYDVMGAIKVWQGAEDRILAALSTQLVQRRFPKIRIDKEPISDLEMDKLKDQTMSKLKISAEELPYYLMSGSVRNNAYDTTEGDIHILFKDNTTRNLADASDNALISSLSKEVVKYYVIYPRF